MRYGLKRGYGIVEAEFLNRTRIATCRRWVGFELKII
jgi:hypothetical protein